MLSTQAIGNFGYNASRVINVEGAYGGALTASLYTWDKDGLHSQPKTIHNPRPNAGKDYRLLQDMYLRSQVLN